MTNEQINKAIAELRGWVYAPEDLSDYPWQDDKGEAYRSYPNCAGCLNAMHNVQEMLTDSQWGVYVNYLTAKTKRDYRRACAEANFGGQMSLFLKICDYRRACAEANARQRAEAFLRTLGKWEEEA